MQKQSRRLTRRIVQLLIGLFGFGIGVSMLLLANLGAASWDVLTQGIIRFVPLTFGTVTIITSVIVLLLWIPLRQRLGIGTVLNALLVGFFIDIGLAVLPEPEGFWWQLLVLLLGILIIGISSGLYLGARLGPGPRDGLMTGLHAHTGWPIWAVRTGLEVSVVAIGWALGGTVGLGTILFALLIGPLCQLFMPIFEVRPADPRPQPNPDAQPVPDPLREA